MCICNIETEHTCFESSTMFLLVIALLLGVNGATVSSVNGEGCPSTGTNSRQVINMCEAGSWRLGMVYVSVTPTNMGSSTRCECTMSGEVQEQITATFGLVATNLTIQNCIHTVLTVRRLETSNKFYCLSSTDPFSLNSTDKISLTLSRPSVMNSASFCLYIIAMNYTENNIQLVCGSGVQTLTTSVTSADPTSDMTSNAEPPVTGKQDQEPKDNKTDLIPPVVGGVVGLFTLIIIVIVVILIVVYTRKKRQNSPPLEERPEVHNVSSEDVLAYNILYESSSVHATYQPLQASQPGLINGRGVYENVNDNVAGPFITENNTSSNQAEISMGNATVATAPAAAAPAVAVASAAAAAGCQPTSNEYAVVNKPGRQQKPTDSRNAAMMSQSTNVTLPSGDVYAVVDKSRTPR